MAIEGLWGGLFSRAPGRWRRRERGFFSRLQLKILEPVPAGRADREQLEHAVREAYEQLRQDG